MPNPESPAEMDRLRILRQAIAEKRKRTADGKFVKTVDPGTSLQDQSAHTIPVVNFSNDETKPTLTSDDPPLVNLKVTNPVTYFKNWWRKVIGNEGIEMKWSFKVKPLTAFMLLAFIFSGGITLKVLSLARSATPVSHIIPSFAKEASFSGVLENVEGDYFLVTNSDSVIRISDTKINLAPYLGQRILVVGNFSEEQQTLSVIGVKRLNEPTLRQ
jgi:hypothetical protein